MLGHGPPGFVFLGFPLQLFPLVVRIPPTGHGQGDLGIPFPEIDIQRDQGQAFFLNLPYEPSNLVAVKEQL